MTKSDDAYVPITGVVHQHTALGVFIDLADRRVFLPHFHTGTAVRRFAPGEIATIQVLRSYAEEEKLIA
jgi:hypothetical protein